MKKYVFMLLACVALFTSCGDDDNKISIATDFRINPSTVIAPFAAVEHNPGELKTFASGYQLRVRLLVYNSEGLLQDEDVQYFSTYSVTMSSSLFLPEGDYKAIVITDVVSENPGEVEYWKLSDYKRLANTHIDDGELIGGRQEILGIATKDFTVGSNSYGEVSIDVQPAGALFFTKYENIHEHDDIGVDFYVLITSKIGHSYVFNSDGSFDASAESSNENIAWTLDRIYPENFEMNVGNVYNYIFVTPFNNMNMQFGFGVRDEGWAPLTDEMTVSPKMGETWYFGIDLETLEYDYFLGNGTGNRTVRKSGAKTMAPVSPMPMNQVQNRRIYLKDIR